MTFQARQASGGLLLQQKMKNLFTLVAVLLIGVLLAAKSPHASLSELHRAAKNGDAWAQLNLGAAYDHGLAGINPNPQIAVSWYRKAAQQGLAKAQFNLAHCLGIGHGVAQNYVEARLWMHKAAKQNMPEAQFLFGVMLVEGLGGLPNKAGGKKWLEKAALAEHQDAIEYLRKL